MAVCDDKFHEECGVFAIYDRNRSAALETYYGIFSLQHRGQESAGITVSDGHTMETFRGMGLVTEVFRKLPEKEGFIGIGHVRYSRRDLPFRAISSRCSWKVRKGLWLLPTTGIW